MSDIVFGIRLNADGTGLINAVKLSKEQMDQLSGGTRNANNEAQRFNDTQNRSSSILDGLNRKLLATAAAYLSFRSAANMVAEYRESELAAQKLNVVINNMHRGTGNLAQELQTLATQLQRQGVIGDDALVEGAAFLAIYGKITDELLPRSMRALANLAALMGKDTAGAARALGMASEGSATMLQRMGIVISEDVLASGDFARVLDELEPKLGDANQQLAQGAGHYDQLGIRIGEAREELGKLIATSPTLKFWSDFFVESFENMTESVVDYVNALRGVPKDFSKLSFDDLLAKQGAIRLDLQRLEDERRNSSRDELEMSGFDRRYAQKQAELDSVWRQTQSMIGPAAAPAAGGGSSAPYNTEAADKQRGFLSKEYDIRLRMVNQQFAAMHEEMDALSESYREQIERENELFEIADQVAVKQREEIAARNQARQDSLNNLSESLLSATELENKRYQESLDLLTAAERQKLASTMSFHDMRERLENQHQTNLVDIANEANREMTEFAIQAARNMENAMADFFFDAMNGKFDNLVGNFAQTLQRMAADLAASEVLKLLTGSFGSTGSMGGIIGSLFSAGTSLLGGGSSAGSVLNVLHAHSGRGPGEIPAQRLVDARIFATAPRFHSGREIPAIIRDDESVLTPGQMKAMGGNNVTVQLTIDARGSDAGVEQRIRQIARDEIIPQAIRGATANTINKIGRVGFA